MKPWIIMIYGLLLGLLVTGLILLIAQPMRGHPVILHPAPTPTHIPPPKPTPTSKPILVQIGGEVSNPGVYSLEENARLSLLVDVAGGLTADADIIRVNLALFLRDGDYFYIPAEDEDIPETAKNAPGNLFGNSDPLFTYPLDLNEASQEALESIPGIGPSKAQDILDYKEIIGRFSSLEELLNVSGIGEATLDILRDYLYVEP